jgi:hypothetical protein
VHAQWLLLPLQPQQHSGCHHQMQAARQQRVKRQCALLSLPASPLPCCLRPLLETLCAQSRQALLSLLLLRVVLLPWSAAHLPRLMGVPAALLLLLVLAGVTAAQRHL